MKKINHFIKIFLLTCVVIAGQAYAFSSDGNSTAWRNDNIDSALNEYNVTLNEPEAKHAVELTVVNKTGIKLYGPSAWLESGQLAPAWFWPQSIPANGGRLYVELYEKDFRAGTGCSGYVNYTLNGGYITFAFSNPYYGTNKVGVGTGGKSVWNNMGNHGYKPFTKKFTVDGVKLKAVASATGGTHNKATIVLSYDN